MAFTPNGGRAYVVNTFGNNLSVVNVAGAGSTLLATVPGIDVPSTVDVDDTGSFVYVANSSGTAPAVYVISTATNTVVRTIPMTGRAVRSAHLSPYGDVLDLAAGTSTGGELVRVSATGATSAILDVTPLSGSPAEMGYSEAIREAVVAQPALDGVDLVRSDETTTFCVGAPNSAGPGASMGWSGFTSVSFGDFTLEVAGAVPNKPGFFYYGSAQSMVPIGDGFRCAGGTIGRLRPATNADATGHNSRAVDFTVPPAGGGGPATILPGSTWYFSYWYRDPGGVTHINLSNGLAVPFTP